jgi:DNA-binding NarL/FixJ family response regulator
MSLIHAKIKISLNENVPLYQKLAPKIGELKALGVSHKEIALKLNISRKTIRKSLLVT